MAYSPTPRANKKAFFSDLSGGHIVEFQFTPEEMKFTEGGKFIEKDMVGHYFNDSMWVSGKASPFDVRMFIDRTAESYMVDGDSDPFEQIKRHPNRFAKYGNLDIVNFVRGIAKGRSSSAFIPDFNKKQVAQTKPSAYSSSPDFAQNPDNTKGVLPDLEALLYYVRPLGLDLSKQVSQDTTSLHSSGDGKTEVKTIKIKDFQQTRFTPPPKVRFFYGDIWREGYIEEVNYTLSILNRDMIPQRLDADIRMICSRWGYLSAIDTSKVSTTPNYMFDKNKIPQ